MFKDNLQHESIDHIITGCKVLAGTEYINKYNDTEKIYIKL